MDRSRSTGRGAGLIAAMLALMLLAACAQTPAQPGQTAPSPAAESPAASPGGGDLLADVRQRGVLRVSTDANYRPQSYRNPDGSWEGFDIDVAAEVARRLGVGVEYLDINFDVITAGSWNGRWDVNVGSMTVTPDRAQVLYFSEPYYFTPAAFAVHTNSAAASLTDLAGKRVGVGAATTYQEYLEGNLTLPNDGAITPAPEGVQVQVYDTDQLALADLALGDGARLDAVLTALPTIQDSIDNGQPFKVVGEPVYYEELAIALDRSSPLDSQSLLAEINRILEEMHSDGTLTELSNKYYGIDLTKRQ